MGRRHWLDYAGIALAGVAVIAASFAAGFSGWQSWIASATAERQLRSYVYIGSFHIDLQNNPDGSSTVTVNPSLKVFGSTPAAWVSPSWDLTILPVWSPGQFPKLPITAGRIDVVAVPAARRRRLRPRPVDHFVQGLPASGRARPHRDGRSVNSSEHGSECLAKYDYIKRGDALCGP